MRTQRNLGLIGVHNKTSQVFKACAIGRFSRRWIAIWGLLWWCVGHLSAAQGSELLVLSEIEERIAGNMAIVSLERRFAEQGYQVHSDPVISAIGRKIAAYSDRPHLNYAFFVIEGDLLPRAFSLPGGYIGLSRSLLDAICQTEADLAFILGHEIAHAALRHYADYKLQDDQQVALVKQLFQTNPAGEIAQKTSSDAFQQVFLPYLAKVRQMKEIEADQFGALYALRAGYAFEGGRQVLSRLRSLHGDEFHLEDDEPVLSSESPPDVEPYPTLSERLEQLEIFRMKADEVTDLFSLGRAALDRGDYGEAALVFESVLSLFPQSRTARIGLGVAHHLRYWDSAPEDDFLLAYPGALELEYIYLLQRGARDVEALEQAIVEYRKVIAAEPGNAYALNNLGVALAEAQQGAEAEALLREAWRLANRDFTVFNLAVVVYQKALATQQTDIRQEALTLMKTYRAAVPQDDVARRYVEELERP